MRRIILLFTVSAVMAVALVVGPVSAHEHQICTPGQGDPMLAEEPFHDDGILHPKHTYLHKGPSAEHREITVVVAGTPCPS